MRLRYQASFFANLTTVQPRSETVVRILQQFTANGLQVLPNMVQEINGGVPGPMPRLRLTSQAGDFEVLVGSMRLDVVKQKASFLDETDLGSLAEFGGLADRCIRSVLDGQDINASRLALIVQSIEAEMPEDELNRRFGVLFNPPEFFNANAPTEWTFRANARRNLNFGEIHEESNSIAKIERVQGQFAEGGGLLQEFDRIITEYDINTLPTNTAERFSPEVLRPFIDAASEIVRLLDANITEKFARN